MPEFFVKLLYSRRKESLIPSVYGHRCRHRYNWDDSVNVPLGISQANTRICLAMGPCIKLGKRFSKRETRTEMMCAHDSHECATKGLANVIILGFFPWRNRTLRLEQYLEYLSLTDRICPARRTRVLTRHEQFAAELRFASNCNDATEEAPHCTTPSPRTQLCPQYR